MSAWVSGWVSEWVDGWVSKWIDRWVSEGMGEWVSEWVRDWIRSWISTKYLCSITAVGGWYFCPPLPTSFVQIQMLLFQQWSLNTAMNNWSVIPFYSVGPRLPVILMETIVSLNWKFSESSLAVFVFSLYSLKDILFMDCKTIDSNRS